MLRKRIGMLGLAVVAIMLIALPVLAQTEEPTVITEEAGPDVAAVVGALITFGLIVKAVVAAVKKAAPQVVGLWTMAVATLAGSLIAALFDFQAAAALAEKFELTGVVGNIPTGAVGWLISGIAIGAASGFFAELGGTSGPNSVPAVIKVEVSPSYTSDEGYTNGVRAGVSGELPPV